MKKDVCHCEDDLNKISKIMKEREEKAFKYDCLVKRIKEKIAELYKYRAGLLKKDLAKEQKDLTSQNVLAVTTFRDIEAYGKIEVLQELLKEAKDE